jgi:hypothetical protein
VIFIYPNHFILSLFCIPYSDNMSYLNCMSGNCIRYCLEVRVIDHTDCATLVIFDKEATALLKKSCVDMLAEHGVVSEWLIKFSVCFYMISTQKVKAKILISHV